MVQTLATDNRFIRQSGLVDESIFDTPVCLIGAGGIGSFTALALAKMGFKYITVWDGDTIEEHNLPNQFYPVDDVGASKVAALWDMINKFTGVGIYHYSAYWNRNHSLDGIVIAAVDSMSTRKEIYDAVKRNANVKCLIDGRMGGNQFEVYTCVINDPKDKKRYKATLWSDEEITNVPCTERAIMYNVLNIASWIVNQVRLVLSGKVYHRALIFDLETSTLVTPVVV